MEKPIANFPDYYITEKGEVVSYKSGQRIVKKPWIDSKKRYLIIGLSKNGKVYKHLVHRLVAQAFIPNPNNYKEIHHKDNNPQNNSVENLRWCTRQYNIQESYKTMSPVRNYVKCDLYYNNEYIASFKSVIEASRFVSKNYGYSFSMINKHLKYKLAEIVRKV